MFRYRLREYFLRRRGILTLCRLLVPVVAIIILLSQLNKMLDSALKNYIDVTLEGLVSAAVNQAVLDELTQGDYRSLVCVSHDKYGKIASVETDAVRITRLKAQISLRTLDMLERPESRKISVPFGTLLGGRLLMGRGPDVGVRLTAVGAANTTVASEFKSAGINQTLHRLILEVEVNITVIMPGSTVLHKVDRQVVMGETVIVGEVPESYTYIDDTRNDTLDKILDYRGG